MNLLAAIIIFWNTMKLGEVVNTRAASGTHIAPDLLAHVSPLGWEHINLTGQYRWPKSLAKDSAPSRNLPLMSHDAETSQGKEPYRDRKSTRLNSSLYSAYRM